MKALNAPRALLPPLPHATIASGRRPSFSRTCCLIMVKAENLASSVKSFLSIVLREVLS